ncbi:MAG TPA: isocitrate lyase/phosphoenolpyruvate mutase family protein [Gemmatimonadales bacterium]|nr:isocitrate lyase/phosphoenolpyruvate mutase family protein [Gemmatimonadales bacterium]
MPTTPDRAAAFRSLHGSRDGETFVLPNAWDAMSARIIEHAGARAIATTSAGVSWALGRPDGQSLTRTEMLAAVRRIVQTVQVPVTADVEGGYGAGTPDDVAETVREVVSAGAVGINLEDGPGRRGTPLLEPEEQQARIAAARGAGSEAGLFINARVDVYLRGVGVESGRFDETVRRARAYVAAGADGIFVPGVVDASTIGRLATALEVPLNIMARSGAPPVGELARLGVGRVSVGPAITLSVMRSIHQAAAELLSGGTYDALADGMSFAEANGLFATG